MGTCYYVLIKSQVHQINEVTRKTEPKYLKLHIGKSSGGWCFSLHLPSSCDFYNSIYSENPPVINTLNDWIKFIWDKTIIDEYDSVIPLYELKDVITERSWKLPEGCLTWEDKLNLLEKTSNDRGSIMYSNRGFNRADWIEGPNNLRRHRIDGHHCVGWGEGTWDYIKGEFS